MLPPPSPRGPLVAPALRDREPLERRRRLPGHDHPRQRGRHLRPQRDAAAALVLEVVELLRDFFPRLAHVQRLVLQHGRVVLLKAERLRRAAPLAEEPVPDAHVLGVDVARAARRREVELLRARWACLLLLDRRAGAAGAEARHAVPPRWRRQPAHSGGEERHCAGCAHSVAARSLIVALLQQRGL